MHYDYAYFFANNLYWVLLIPVCTDAGFRQLQPVQRRE